MKQDRGGWICLGPGTAMLDTFAGSELFGLLQDLVCGWLVKQVAVVTPRKQIGGNRINDIYRAFLFQGTYPPVMRMIPSPRSAKLDPEGSFQLNWTRITLAMGKVLQSSHYLVTGLTFPLVSHNQSCRRPSPPPFTLCSIESTS